MKQRIQLLIILFILLTNACAPSQTETSLPEAPTRTPAPPATPEPASRSLSICLGDEPSTLYPYGKLNASARSVLSALYDGPMDVSEFGYEPVILEKIPSLEDGDAQVNPVTVNEGDVVVDASGAVVELTAGTRIRPEGCRSDSCAVTYDGSSTLEMDQMIVTFIMLENLTWSDGEPMTADDSVYSFGLSANAVTPTNKFIHDRTQTYEAADDITVQWWGIPGFIDPEYFTNFWMPLPRHAWSEFSPAQLLTVETSTKAPMGWGPYIIDDWTPGESIHLLKNLNYFRGENGLPNFDELTFYFMPDANAALTSLVDGTCDVLDPSIDLDGQLALLQQMQKDGQALLYTAQSNTMEWLNFGIRHVSYDNGFNSTGANPDRPDYFGDVRVRKAIAICLDRKAVVDTVLLGLSSVPDSYLPFDHPLHNGNLQTYSYDPASGRQILDQVGWIDHDKDPSTPRRALGVTRVPNGTPLVLNYVTTTATQRRQTVEILTASLAECGIGLNPVYYSASDLYEQGAGTPLFGRTFDLAEFAIGVPSLEPQCGWFTSDQVPNEANGWVGINVGGYSDPDFDAACAQARESLPNEPEYTSHQVAQSLFASELPAVPLYTRLRIAASRNDFCGLHLDASSQYPLSNIELFDYGTGCE